jgi:hypothetical protein
LFIVDNEHGTYASIDAAMFGRVMTGTMRL